MFSFFPSIEYNSLICSENKFNRELWSPSNSFYQNSETEENISNNISSIEEKSSSLNHSQSNMAAQKIMPVSDYSNQKEKKK